MIASPTDFELPVGILLLINFDPTEHICLVIARQGDNIFSPLKVIE
jgi:hypothetical protein